MQTAKRLDAEVIAIGSELLLGQVVDTNSAHLGRELTTVGIHLSQITAVGDELDRIVQVLKAGLDRSDIVITTGGLGPTEDDLTREAVAAATGQKLVFQPRLMREIESIFKARGFRMAPNNRKQAYIPSRATAISNPMGTAPGFILEDERGVIISLPGVPREFVYLLKRVVIPYLKRRNKLGRQVILIRVLRVCGLGESGVDKQIGDLIRNCQNPRIGLLASPGDIKISVVGHGGSREEAERLIDPIEKEIRNRMGHLIYGVDAETLEGKVAEYLTRLNLRLSVADTFTRGLLCQRILGTGTRRCILGFLLPSRKAQRSFLRLPGKAFSSLVKNQEVYSIALAKRLLDYAEVGLAITGDFSRSNGELKGTLTIAIAEGNEEKSKSWNIGGTRDGLALRASIIALDSLRKYLMAKTPAEN